MHDIGGDIGLYGRSWTVLKALGLSDALQKLVPSPIDEGEDRELLASFWDPARVVYRG